MNTPFPEDDLLVCELSKLFRTNSIQIISREHSIRSSTFPAEIIRCSIDSTELLLLCKYLNGKSHNNFGHRGAIEYEAKIYSDLLSKISLPVAKYYGTCKLKNHDLWMVIEFLDTAELLWRSEEESQMERSVEWIANFHKLFENFEPDYITKYSARYYLVWPDKVDEIVASNGNKYPWLINVTNYFRNNISILTEAPKTIIHGEYYPNNILIHKGQIKPIDWESVAIAPGELDLAAAIDGHTDEMKKTGVEAYITTRWHDNDFDRRAFKERLLMAQLYFHFRWIGGKPKKYEKYAHRFDDLLRLSSAL
jgi:aminoglycoside phosphotransferase (APT) family kinase protein